MLGEPGQWVDEYMKPDDIEYIGDNTCLPLEKQKSA